jgi:hypothetical protein
VQRRVIVLLVLVLVPATAVGYQLAQVADAKGCPSVLVPSQGPLIVRVWLEQQGQASWLDARALATYLTDRFGRPVHVAVEGVADETGFRLAAAARPFSSDVLAFFGYRASFPNVPTAHGMVDALGFATPGSACAYVSFIPAEPVPCDVRGTELRLQPAFAYLAHETGHLLGLGHTPQGIMGKGVFGLCERDLFSEAQQQALASWGRA